MLWSGITVTGVRSTSLSWLQSRYVPGESIDIDMVQTEAGRLTVLLADSGYLNAVVEPVAEGDGYDRVRLLVRPGVRFRVRRWELGDVDSAGATILARVLPRGRRYSRAAVEQWLTVARRALFDAGYPFASVAVVSVAESSGWLIPTVKAQSGPRPLVAAVGFTPAGVPARLLQRLMRFRVGQFSAARLDRWRRNLESYGFVIVDSIGLTLSATGDTGVMFHLKRVGASEIQAAAGYAPTERRLAGHARVFFGNLFESGRGVAGSWQGRSGETRYQLSYTEPTVLKSPVDVSVELFHQTLDTSRALTRGTVSAGLLTAESPVRLLFAAGRERQVSIYRSERYDYSWAGTGLDLDLFDNRLNPTRGWRAALANQFGFRRADSGTARIVDRSQFDGEAALPFGRFVPWVGTGLRHSYSPVTLTYSELYRMGGAGSLRGVRPDEISAPILGWLRAEPRWVPARSWRAYPFIDFGAWLDAGRLRTAWSWGVGARFVTSSGVAGIDYGVAGGRSPLAGYVHLNLAIRF